MKTKNNFKEGDLVIPRSFRLFDTGLNENSLGRVMFDENNLLHVRWEDDMGRPWRVYPWEIEIGGFENVLRRHNEIVPREARNSFRTIEICKAIIRQVERGVAIPNEWKEELDTLI